MFADMIINSNFMAASGKAKTRSTEHDNACEYHRMNDLSLWKIPWEVVPEYTLPQTDLTVIGRSRAARNTGFRIPKWNILLDCGLESDFHPDDIFITHLHNDHAYFVAKTLIDNENNPRIFVSSEQRKRLLKGGIEGVSEKLAVLLRNDIHSSFHATTLNPTPKIHNKYRITELAPGGVLDTKINTKPCRIRGFWCDHSVPTIGYGFSELREKLKPEFTELKDEYKDLSNKELKALKKKGIEVLKISNADITKLRKDGIEIMEEQEYPLFCFLGDTTHRVFYKSRTNEYLPELEKYPNIFVESTYLYDEHIKEAHSTQHMHWNELRRYIMDHPDINFIVYHFSLRYKAEEIISFFEKEVKKHGIKNIKPWI